MGARYFNKFVRAETLLRRGSWVHAVATSTHFLLFCTAAFRCTHVCPLVPLLLHTVLHIIWRLFLHKMLHMCLHRFFTSMLHIIFHRYLHVCLHPCATQLPAGKVATLPPTAWQRTVVEGGGSAVTSRILQSVVADRDVSFVCISLAMKMQSQWPCAEAFPKSLRLSIFPGG